MMMMKSLKSFLLARDSICYSALYAIARPSVCPLSIRHTGGSVENG